MKKFLIFRTDRVGDFILSCILIKSIKRNKPNSEITVICSDKNYEYVKNYSLVDNANTLVAGSGSSTIPRTKTSLSGAATLALRVGQCYRTADTGLIITVTSVENADNDTALNFTAGAIKFIVEYIM